MDEDLLLDLEDLGGDEDDELDELLIKQEPDDDDDENLDAMDEDGGDAMDVQPLPDMTNVHDLQSVAKLSGSKLFKDVVTRIDQFVNTPRNPAQNVGPVEEDPEYKLIVQSNNMTVEVDNEMLIVHKYIRDHYAPKFPELESLIPYSIDYARTVKLIGNEMDLTQFDLKALLPSATVMVVTVTATTTTGTPLSDIEIDRVLSACDMLLELDAAKRKILSYVESRMSFIAPNLSILLGSNTAAKMMGLSGGLKGLSKIPACDIILLGKTSKMNTGMSSVTQRKHEGMVYFNDMIVGLPQEWKRQAARILSAKVALASRVDQGRSHPDGAIGRKYREEVQKKIDGLQAPPPGKSVKALPIPDEGPKKRRAGKRFRKAKDRQTATELSKAANRMQFGVAEEEIGFSSGSTRGLGLTGTQSGKIRQAQADPRTKLGVAKKHQKQWGQNTHGGGAASGLSSSVAFTPVKGIELENPEAAAQRVQAANGKYFASAAFVKSGKRKEPPE
ncbi:U4/U6 small nuclear ribonucleoprotein Prp31 [Thoreauomyces humboldtii]|nr:U4/U6 small nuclear ribonucleoprotein Prp31 [Thoreauomyces humboldtii]